MDEDLGRGHVVQCEVRRDGQALGTGDRLSVRRDARDAPSVLRVPAEGAAGRDDLSDPIGEYRERTRGERMRVARAAEERFGTKVFWGVLHEGRRVMFTHLAVPAMTRLRQPERQVLDTLVAGGVARSRSEALAWCVRLVGENTEAWLSDLRDALRHVQEVRRQGPGAPRRAQEEQEDPQEQRE